MKKFLLLVLLAGAVDERASAQGDTVSHTAVRQYSAADRLHRDVVAVPGNIVVAPLYHRALESILARSATFRGQCRRIANEPGLVVYVRHTFQPLPGGVRATTQIVRPPDGGLVAHITLHPYDSYIEMMAHELEHIIEQLDDVDLREKARRSRSGVQLIQGNDLVFETRRAFRIGRRVLDEVSRSDEQGI